MSLAIFKNLEKSAALFRWHALSTIVAAMLGGISAEADACTFIAPIFMGTDNEKAAWEKQVRQAEIDAKRTRQKRFKTAVESGNIDSASELSKLLVPDLTPPFIQKDMCGGSRNKAIVDRQLVASFVGTEFEGLSADRLMDFVARFARNELDFYNQFCSEEFRARFANQLNRRLSRRELNKALLSLSQKGERTLPYFTFSDDAGLMPPKLELKWKDDADLVTGQNPAVMLAVQAVWGEVAPLIGQPQLACPVAYGRLVKDRDALIRELSARPYYSARVAEAAKARAQR